MVALFGWQDSIALSANYIDGSNIRMAMRVLEANMQDDRDEKWKLLTSGLSMSSDFNLECLYIAFANHLQYLEAVPRFFTNHIFSTRYSGVGDIITLDHRVSKIISQRVIVKQGQAKDRLFRLGSEVVAIAFQPGPEWQQLRRSIFNQIVGAAETDRDLHPKLWSDFVNNTREDITLPRRERPVNFLEGSSFSTE